ncbi:helix-turn-helix domain-containing protein [Arcanobacterium canis]
MASRQMMQNQLADATGISTATINRILKNARVIDINELDAICEALNIEAWAVLREAQHPNWRYALAADQQDLTAEEEQRIMEQEP